MAIDNLLQAELEGAQELAPDTYNWAKHKIYEDKKLILKHFDDQKIIEDAIDDACAASAKLLSIVRHQQRDQQEQITKPDAELDAISVLTNEGGPVI